MESVKAGIIERRADQDSTSPSAKIDRVVLDPKSVEVVKAFSTQAQKALGDLIEVSQKEIINFILQERSQPFTEHELAKVRERNFDLVKALQHATELAKKAKTVGKEISMDDIFKFIQTPIVIENQPSKSARGRKKKELTPSGTASKSSIDCKANNAINDTISDHADMILVDSKIEKSSSL